MTDLDKVFYTGQAIMAIGSIITIIAFVIRVSK